MTRIFIFVISCGILTKNARVEAADKPKATDAATVVFMALSDNVTINGKRGDLEFDPDALARVLTSSDHSLAALAKDAKGLVSRRLQWKLATEAWRRSATSPDGIREEFLKNILRDLAEPVRPENRNVTDDLLVVLQSSTTNDARIMSTAELLGQLEKIQGDTLLPVVESRFPDPSHDAAAVNMSVKIEKKLPAEMTLTNTGKEPLHNIVVWFYIEMNPLPGVSAEEVRALAAAYLLGTQRAVLKRLDNKRRQDQVSSLGSRNIVFIKELKPKESAKIPYELGSIRYSKRAQFHLYSDELKVKDQEISGVKEMQKGIEKLFGNKT